MDSLNERYSIKNLLFTKAIPNYSLPVPTAGYKVFGCSDCGDKFLFQSSYEYHLNRKSVKISYFCRHCNTKTFFYNRCNLLSHIRSHTFKSATINVSDLKIEPLPLQFFEPLLSKTNATKSKKKAVNDSAAGGGEAASTSPHKQNALGLLVNTSKNSKKCPECDLNLFTNEVTDRKGLVPIERAKHFMSVTGEIYTCPICLFALPTMCAFKTHLRVHFRCGPYYCPECGMTLQAKGIIYPYMDHQCEGFKMMRASTRIKCPVPDCHLLNPADLKDHIRDNHMQLIYKCSECYLACFDESIIIRHISKHGIELTKRRIQNLQFYQCALCPGKLIFHQQVHSHILTHTLIHNFMFPCWVCGTVLDKILSLLEHYINAHNDNFSNDIIREWFSKILQNQKVITEKSSNTYRVVKKCDQCQRNFSYKCDYDQINKLPNECPYKCSKDNRKTEELIKCFTCNNNISQNWDDVKRHFQEHHPMHKCLDAKIVLPRLNIEKYINVDKSKTRKVLKRKSNRKKKVKHDQNEENCMRQDSLITERGEFECKKCGQRHENKSLLEKHLLIHRDWRMAYQCMECGQSFVVKPSFSKHLLLEHNITNVDEYIVEKQCYNEEALQKHQDQPVNIEPLKENQCKICRDQFDNLSDLEKHFRVHGMAFLMKNNATKNVSP